MRLQRFLGITVCILCVGFFSLQAQETASGTVFLDQNNNGVLDAGEEGIPDVPVSNGRQVVTTDELGKYSIKINKNEGKVFVIKPAGYQVPTDEQNHPKFYYLHKPKGSPDLKYQGVEPTGKLPEAINFPLLKTTFGKRFKALIFGDPQPEQKKELGYFDRDIVSELHNATEYAFGITLGDMVDERLDWFSNYSKSVAKIGIPWFHVYGNNDMNMEAESDSAADETFEATFGPATYSFNKGNAHFIILDDIIYPRKDGGSGYRGGFTDKQIEFLKNDLKHVSRDKLIVVAFHIPIFGSFPEEDRKRLFNILDKYPHTLSISAHTHEQQFRFFDESQGWDRLKPHIHYNVGTTSGSWWTGVPDNRGIPPATMRDGTPNGYATLNVDGNSFTIDYKAANKSADYKMSMWGPEVVAKASGISAQLYVNYFLGSKLTDVEYRYNGLDDWRYMRRVEQADPHLTTVMAKWDMAEKVLEGKRPINPSESTHLWTMFLPTHLPLGKQTIQIRVTDMFGRTFTDEFTYEVVKPKQ